MTLPQSFLDRPLAHRALHDLADGRPENSRAAIHSAIEKGYGIEIDLQLSADNQAMVFHDYRLDRLANSTGPIRAHSAKTLGATMLRGGEEGIPTFAEVLELIDGRVPLLVELKDQEGQLGPNVGTLERATAKAARGYSGPIAVMSFNPHSVLNMANLMPQIPRGITTSSFIPEKWGMPESICTPLRDISDYDRAQCCFISHEVDDLGRPRVSELKSKGAALLCWTVKSAQQEITARKVADNITFEQYLA
jgi:glycerophosphoryl diester phosphodiesterase